MIVLLILGLALVGGTIIYGATGAQNGTLNTKKFKKVVKINIGAILPVVVLFMVLAFPMVSKATSVSATATGADIATTDTTTTTTTDTTSVGTGLKYIAIALSTGLAAVGAGYAVAMAASSSIGAVSEDDKIMGKTLIYVGLAEGIVLYGMIISFMILFVG
ncbi:MAG: ATP synthase subunit C [Oscillospiraceae bacterium]|nr:ATP synthase subunit C [Oscillospiraceae bacterium]